MLLPWLWACPGPVHAAALLAVSQSQTAAPVAGSPVTYQIVVENNGTGPVTDLTVTDTVAPVLTSLAFDQPPGFTAPLVTDVTPSGTLVSWSAGSLAMNVGDTLTFTITGMVGLVCPPVVVTSTAWAWGWDGASADSESAIPITFPLTMAITTLLQQTPPFPSPNQPITYDLFVNNTGQVTIENLTVVDTVAAGVVGPSVQTQPAGFAVQINPGPAGALIYTWTGGGVAPGASLQFSLTATLGASCVPITVSNTGWVLASSVCTSTQMSLGPTEVSIDPGSLVLSATIESEAGDGWVVLWWTAQDETINGANFQFITGYNLWRSDDGGFTYTLAGSLQANTVPSVPTDTRAFWDRGLTDATLYTYRVQALTTCATAFYSSIAVTPTQFVGSIPVFGDAAAAGGDGYVHLSWPFPPLVETHVTVYRIFRATLASFTGPDTTPLTDAVNTGSRNDSQYGVTNLQRYFYMVTPCCPDRSPSFVNATPYRPSRGQGTPGAQTDSSGPRAVRVFWDPAIPGDYPVIGYDIFRSDDGGASAHLVGTVLLPVPTLSFIDTVPGYGKQYVYIIRPIDYRAGFPPPTDKVDGAAYPAVLIFVAIPVNRTFLNHNQFHPGRNEQLQMTFQITEPGHVRVSIFTPTGERVRTIWDRDHRGSITPDTPFNSRDQGIPPLVWDGTNDRGELVGSGAYLVVLEINKARDFRAIVVVR